MDEMTKPIANPSIVLREEFDDWAILFDPDTDDIFAVDEVSVFIWKRLDGKHTTADIAEELKPICDGIPENAADHIDNFLQDLVKRGLAGYEIKKG